MRLTQNGLENLTRDVIDINKYIELEYRNDGMWRQVDCGWMYSYDPESDTWSLVELNECVCTNGSHDQYGNECCLPEPPGRICNLWAVPLPHPYFQSKPSFICSEGWDGGRLCNRYVKCCKRKGDGPELDCKCNCCENFSTNCKLIIDLCDNGFVQYLPDKKQIWFCFHIDFCLVYDLHRGVWFRFSFTGSRGRLINGYFSGCNKFFFDRGVCSISDYPSSKYTDAVSRVRTRKFLGKSKIIYVRTLSKFDSFRIKYQNIRMIKWAGANYDDIPYGHSPYYRCRRDGIYMQGPGLKGDMEFEFDNVEMIDKIELFYK
jgi:hypothetical protein